MLGLIGRGGMGEVYAAYDPELNRKIAIKLVVATDAGNATAKGRVRLLREAQAIARVSNPNVVVVHDVGTFGDAVFIAMEFIEGDTLRNWLQARKRDWREILDVFIAAGRGLAAAHAADLVHRDFKPDNVMITGSGEVRVMDFGLAREYQDGSAASVLSHNAAVEDRTDDAVRAASDVDATATLSAGPDRVSQQGVAGAGYLGVKLTRTGAMMGTPAYMAPEQFAGESTDSRTDQFSFAVALWEALHRQRPFAGDDVVELMVTVASGAVQEPPPDTRVPGWIRSVLLRGMRVDRMERFRSMEDLLAALGRDPASGRRRWIAAVAAGLVLAATVVGTRRLVTDRHVMCAAGSERALPVWDAERRRGIEHAFTKTGNPGAAQAFTNTAALIDDYVARWTRLYKDTCEATHVRGDQSGEVLDLRMDCLGERLGGVRALVQVLTGADANIVENAVAAASTLPTLERCSDVPLLRAVVKPPEDSKTRARVAALREQVATVTTLGSAGACERASAAGEKLLAETSALAYQPLTAEALLAVGRLGDACTDPVKAAALIEEASFAAEMSHDDHVVIEAAHFATGFYAERLHDLPTAHRWLRHGEAVLARFPGHPILDAWLTIARSVYLLQVGQTAAAINEMRRALALLEKERGPNHFDVAVCLQDLALELYEDRQFAEALPPMLRSLELNRRLFGGDNARTAASLINYGKLLTALRRFEEAHASLEHGLAILRKQNASPYFIGESLLYLGRAYVEAGEPKRARATLLDALRMLGTSNSQLVAETKFALARAVWTTPAERDQALQLALQAREMLKEPGQSRVRAAIDTWSEAHDGD